MPPADRGSLALDPTGAYATLTFHRTYAHPPARVWDAIATPEGLAGWLLAKDVRIDGKVGGTIAMTAGPPGYRSTGTILAWDPPRLLEYDWKVDPVAEMPSGERGTFRYELTPQDDGGGTALVVTIRRITAQTARGFLPGQHAFLDRLAAQLDGVAADALPDWFARFAALRASYPEWTHA